MAGSFSVTYAPEPTARHILFSYRGRIDRKIYWKWSIFAGIVSFLTIFLGFVALTLIADDARSADQSESRLLQAGILVLLLVTFVAGWVYFAILAKRLHDLGRSGWFGLLILIPIIGQFGVLFYAAGIRGNALANKYGNPTTPSDTSLSNVIVYLIGLTLFFGLSVAGRAYIVERYNVPSSSNLPGLMPGDYVFVSKYRYRLGSPARGDVVVFVNPRTGGAYIKRIAALPGDTVKLVHGILAVNDKPWTRARIDDYEERDQLDRSGDEAVEMRFRYVETLPDGPAHEILGGKTKYPEDSLPQDSMKPVTIPEGRFFAIGDNRDNSADSRMQLGTVPLDNLLGRVEFCYFSVKPGSMFDIRWSRLFRVVR
jgi:signal peptidase I